MARPHGRAVVDPTSPRAFACCDRCSFWYNLQDLKWQYEWAGVGLQNLRLLVCDPCYDRPQEQLRTIVLPPDPLPVINARPEAFAIDENDYRVTEDSNQRVLEDGTSDRVNDTSANEDVS